MKTEEKRGTEEKRSAKERILEGLFITIVGGIIVFLITNYVLPSVIDNKNEANGAGIEDPIDSQGVETENNLFSETLPPNNSNNIDESVTPVITPAPSLNGNDSSNNANRHDENVANAKNSKPVDESNEPSVATTMPTVSETAAPTEPFIPPEPSLSLEPFVPFDPFASAEPFVPFDPFASAEPFVPFEPFVSAEPPIEEPTLGTEDILSPVKNIDELGGFVVNDFCYLIGGFGLGVYRPDEPQYNIEIYLLGPDVSGYKVQILLPYGSFSVPLTDSYCGSVIFTSTKGTFELQAFTNDIVYYALIDISRSGTYQVFLEPRN